MKRAKKKSAKKKAKRKLAGKKAAKKQDRPPVPVQRQGRRMAARVGPVRGVRDRLGSGGIERACLYQLFSPFREVEVAHHVHASDVAILDITTGGRRNRM